MEPGRPGRQARSLAPDHQRHRNGQVRPQPAARLRHREAVRQTDRKDLFSGEITMNRKFFAGLALAFSLLAPAFSAPVKFETGALQVEQVSKKGPALILIPGLACGPWVWDQTTTALRDRYSIYLLTLPGFDGRAPQPGVTLETLQRDLLSLIESKKL